VRDALKVRPGAEVWEIEVDLSAAVPEAAKVASVVNGVDAYLTEHRTPNEYFDCVVLTALPKDRDGVASLLARLAPLLNSNGVMVIPLVRAGLEGDPAELGELLASALARAELVPYRYEQGEYPPARVCIATRPSYNPVTHARSLFDAGHPDLAYDVLSRIPEPYLADGETASVLAVEAQLYLLAWERTRTDAADTLKWFWMAQLHFYEAVDRAPALQQAYQCQAEFWHRLGNDDMAIRLLRSIQTVAPTPLTQRQLRGYARKSPTEPAEADLAPRWSTPARLPRILFITHPRPHYGLDVLYDGLCSVLGDERVEEYPWKPLLHGAEPNRLVNYPCRFDRSGQPQSLDDILHALRTGQFDFVLFGDFEMSLDRDSAGQIMEAAQGIPLFLVDAQDDPLENRKNVLEFLGRPAATAYFKREMLGCVDYGPRTYPLPFAHADGYVPEEISGPRPNPLFWAGHRIFGLRRFYLEHIEAVLGRKFDKSYTQAEYIQTLRSSQIGLNIFGKGFDTVRYWEVPAHGCMLLAERLPIRIPHNFRDGESAVFFDALDDLEGKLRYYLSHPQQSAVIAQKGYAHLKRHHTGSARARQFLAWAEQAIREAYEV
jgi:hypothetical protein